MPEIEAPITYYTLPEAAEILGTHYQTIRNRIRRGWMYGQKIGRSIIFSDEEIVREMRQGNKRLGRELPDPNERLPVVDTKTARLALGGLSAMVFHRDLTPHLEYFTIRGPRPDTPAHRPDRAYMREEVHRVAKLVFGDELRLPVSVINNRRTRRALKKDKDGRWYIKGTLNRQGVPYSYAHNRGGIALRMAGRAYGEPYRFLAGDAVFMSTWKRSGVVLQNVTAICSRVKVLDDRLGDEALWPAERVELLTGQLVGEASESVLLRQRQYKRVV